ncbi:MAG: hypothetical protein AMXMBFR84_21770 [Candidatus Hydrogenedentota bacterium]
MSSTSALQLKACRIREFVLSSLPAEAGANFQLSFSVRRRRNENVFKIPLVLQVQIKEPHVCLVRLSLDAVFILPKDYSEEEIRQYVPGVCLANLYSMARGIVAQSSGMFEGGPFLLPVVNMNELLKSSVEEMAPPEVAVGRVESGKPRMQ